MNTITSRQNRVCLLFVAGLLTLTIANANQVPWHCRNDPEKIVRFHTQFITRSETCEWVGKNRPDLCFQEDVNDDGVLIGNQCSGQCPEVSGCPVSAPPVSESPTKLPTKFPSASPSTSSFPTLGPTQSRSPTAQPSPSPSHAPTDLPSLSPPPTTSPTVSTSDYPSITPSIVHTDIPSETPSAFPISFAQADVDEGLETSNEQESTDSALLREKIWMTKELTLSVTGAEQMNAEEVRVWSRLVKQWFENYFFADDESFHRRCKTKINYIRQNVMTDQMGVPANFITYNQTIVFVYNATTDTTAIRSRDDFYTKFPLDDDLENLSAEEIAALPFRPLASNSRLAVNLRHYIDAFREVEIPLGTPMVQRADEDIDSASFAPDTSSGNCQSGKLITTALFVGVIAWLGLV